MPASTCPKCSSHLQEGFVVDRGRHGVRQASWAEGKPEWAFWTGTKTRGRAHYPIVTYRWGRCGFLESYAGAG